MNKYMENGNHRQQENGARKALNPRSVRAGYDVAPNIPAEFYAQILAFLAMSLETNHLLTIGVKIMQQALAQLDPQRAGAVLRLALFVAPDPNRAARTLHEVIACGTPPWDVDIYRPLLLGAESLAGYAMASGHTEVCNNKDCCLHQPLNRQEASSAAFPLYRAGQLAGCVIISSTQADFFTANRRALIDSYTDLLALVIPRSQFYPLERVQLAVVPEQDVQRPYLAQIRARITHVLRETSNRQQPLSIDDAVRQVWRQLEDEILALL